MTFFRCLPLIVLALSVVGCGKPGPQLYKVVGTVQWKGESVEQGNIIFEPFDRETHPQGAKIVGGKYQLRIGAGKMKVQIFASREQPGKINPDMNAPVLEHYIPPEFNRRTTLEAEVMPNDDNKLSFDLPPPAVR